MNTDYDIETQVIFMVMRNPLILPRIRLVPDDFELWPFQWKEILEKAEKKENISFAGDFTFDRSQFMLIDTIDFIRESDLEEMCAGIKAKKILKNLKKINSLEEAKSEIDKEFTKLKIPTASEVFQTLGEEYCNNQDMISQGKSIMFQSDWRWFDENIFLRKKHLVTIAARPKIGKSTFAMNLALRLSKRGQKGIYFNLEMTDQEILFRAISCTQNAPLYDLLDYSHNDIFGLIGAHLEQYPNLTLFSPTKGLTSSEVDSYAENYDFIVIDQLQTMTDRREKNIPLHQHLGRITAQLKQTAIKTNTLVIICAQINREGAFKPTVANLKDCGRIEEDSDIVLILHRVTPQDPETFLHVACARSQPYGQTKNYYLDGKICSFNER